MKDIYIAPMLMGALTPDDDPEEGIRNSMAGQGEHQDGNTNDFSGN